jgi:hypothetical protein
MDSNFISVFRSIPLWPSNLIPLDEILHRLLKALGIDTDVDPLLLIGGVLGFRDINVHRFDGVTTVTGQIVIATELAFAPFQSYVGFVVGDPSGGDTSFPFSLRIKDEPPIKNSDDIFEIEANVLDPQLAAFQPVEKNPEAGFFDVASWRVSLRNIPAKIRMLKGVTRVEPLVQLNLPSDFVTCLRNTSMPASSFRWISTLMETSNSGRPIRLSKAPLAIQWVHWILIWGGFT